MIYFNISESFRNVKKNYENLLRILVKFEKVRTSSSCPVLGLCSLDDGGHWHHRLLLLHHISVSVKCHFSQFTSFNNVTYRFKFIFKHFKTRTWLPYHEMYNLHIFLYVFFSSFGSIWYIVNYMAFFTSLARYSSACRCIVKRTRHILQINVSSEAISINDSIKPTWILREKNRNGYFSDKRWRIFYMNELS